MESGKTYVPLRYTSSLWAVITSPRQCTIAFGLVLREERKQAAGVLVNNRVTRLCSPVIIIVGAAPADCTRREQHRKYSIR